MRASGSSGAGARLTGLSVLAPAAPAELLQVTLGPTRDSSRFHANTTSGTITLQMYQDSDPPSPQASTQTGKAARAWSQRCCRLSNIKFQLINHVSFNRRKNQVVKGGKRHFLQSGELRTRWSLGIHLRPAPTWGGGDGGAELGRLQPSLCGAERSSRSSRHTSTFICVPPAAAQSKTASPSVRDNSQQ